MRKKSSALPAVLMAIFTLAVVLVLMQQIHRNLKMTLSPAPTNVQIGVLDSTYYCAPYKFLLTLPNHQWQVLRLSDTLQAVTADTTTHLWSQILWLVQFHKVERDTLAKGRVGLLNWPSEVSHYDIAVQFLAEHLQMVEADGRRVTILQPVTYPAHQFFPSSYFVIIIPTREANRVMLCCVLARRTWAYIIECSATEANYDNLRTEIQKLVRGFRSFTPTKKDF